MQEDLRHHKEMHEHYRARCDVQQKVRTLPVILLKNSGPGTRNGGFGMGQFKWSYSENLNHN